MGNLREWSNQAAGSPPTGYETHVLYPWAALLHGIDPGTGGEGGSPTAYSSYNNFFMLDDPTNGGDGTFDIATELYFLRDENGGNPYNVSAYDPTLDLLTVDAALRDLRDIIAGYSTDSHLSDATRVAIEQARLLLGEDTIDDLVAAETARMRPDYLRAKSDLLTDLWMSGGLIVTQTAGDLAVLEDAFNDKIADFSARLRTAREDQRAQMALQLTTVGVQNKDRRAALQQVYVAAAIDALRVRATAKQDQIEKNLEYDVARRFHNVSLLQLALNANSAIYGAQIVPRAQTKGERLVGAVTSSLSMGIQGGMAMGNPAAGFALGGVNLLTQLLQ